MAIQSQRIGFPSGNVAIYLLDGKEPSHTALLSLDRSYTFGELQSSAAAVAHYLISQGGRKGDRVVLASENSFFWVSAYLGTLLAGMVSVPVAPNTASEDLDHIVRLTEPRFAFLQSKIAVTNAERFSRTARITDAPRGASGLAISFDDVRHHALDPCGKVPQVSSGDLAAIIFTSGSTGTPRGVKISHSNIIANTESIIQYLKLKQTDRIMAVLPLYYCFGASLLHTHLRVGGSLVLDLRFMYPDTVLKRMVETECTGFAGVPSHYQILLRRSSLSRMSFPSLRCVQQAGGHLAPVFVRELQAALPGTQIFLMYGQTEATARLSYLPPELVGLKSGSIGKAIPGVRLRVVTSEGTDAGPNETGEIVAEGDNISLGYWRDPAETETTFRDGKLHTGDLATVDEDGFLYLVDRAKDFVKCGGERVSCQSVEEQLLEFDALLEAAVIGIPDEVLGEAIKLFVVPRESGAPDLENRLRRFCKQHLPPRLNPKIIVVLNSLPKNSAGKVLKAALRQI
ncbi:MAG: class I adenylate-forming enzyme family protein [Terriglobales bacterium]